MPYKVDTTDELIKAQNAEAEATRALVANKELTEKIINQMILNKEEISESLIRDIQLRAENEFVARTMGEPPIHEALKFLQKKDLNIEISS